MTLLHISSKEFEEWVFVNHCPVYRPLGRNSFELPLSRAVRIRLTVTLDEVSSGKCYMRLESRVNARRLSRKGAYNVKAARVREWQQEWGEALTGLMQGYENLKDVIEADATKTHDEHKRELLPLIEKFPKWKDDWFLQKCASLLKKGKWLTPGQEERLRNFSPRARQRSPGGGHPRLLLDAQDAVALRESARQLQQKVRGKTDRNSEWLRSFSESIVQELGTGRGLTAKQITKLQRECGKNGVPYSPPNLN